MDSKRATILLHIIRYNIFGAVGLLSASGGFTGQPDMAALQSILSKTAYFQFTLALVALVGVCGAVLFFKGVYIGREHRLVSGQSHPGSLVQPQQRKRVVQAEH